MVETIENNGKTFYIGEMTSRAEEHGCLSALDKANSRIKELEKAMGEIIMLTEPLGDDTSDNFFEGAAAFIVAKEALNG